MDMFRSCESGSHFLGAGNEKGQTLVEYILLLSVVLAVGIALFRSERFRAFLGPQSGIFAEIRTYMEYTYRHGSAFKGQSDESNYENVHDTYIKRRETRFFSPLEKYPGDSVE